MVIFLRLKTLQPVLRFNIDFPWQGSRRAIQFLVDEVTPAANCLAQGQRDGYRERPVDALAAALLLEGWLEQQPAAPL